MSNTNSSNSSTTSTTSKSNKRNRSSKRDVSLSSKSSLFESVAANVSSDLQTSTCEAEEQARKGQRTYEQVCETFEGLNEYLDSIVTGLLTSAGVLDTDTMLQVAGWSDREAWLCQSGAHKGGVALMKEMLNRVPKRDETGAVLRFSEGPLTGKPILTRVGTRALPEFNDGSEEALHGAKLFTTTECAAIHGAFWSKWEQHPVVAAIVQQHEDFKSRGNRRQNVEVAAPEPVVSESGNGFNVIDLSGVKPSHEIVQTKEGKTHKRRISRRASTTDNSAE